MNYRIDFQKVSSDLVYPMEHGYYYDAQLDPKWVKMRVQMVYNAEDIQNKYAVELPTNSGHKILVVNHDHQYYIINKPV